MHLIYLYKIGLEILGTLLNTYLITLNEIINILHLFLYLIYNTDTYIHNYTFLARLRSSDSSYDVLTDRSYTGI